MRKWALLIAAVVTEVTATLSLRASQDHAAWLALVVSGYLAAFVLLTLVLRAGMPVGVTVDGRELFGGRTLRVPPRSGWVLPLGLDVAGVRVTGGTGEVAGVAEGAITFRLAGLDDGPGHVELAPGTTVLDDAAYRVSTGEDGAVRVTPVVDAATLTVHLA